MSLQRFVVTLAALTFVLLLMGGLVHNTRSSLACPDWPLCFGQLMPKMEGGVAIEHSHRLVASTVGMLTLILMILLVRRGRKEHDRRLIVLGIITFGLVIIQGILGGITVLYRLPTLVSTTHLAVSMIFFSLLVHLAFRLSRKRTHDPLDRPRSLRTQRLTLLAGLLVYGQMVLGALMRHLGAGLACVELPLCHHQFWPSQVHPNVLIHMAHRWMAGAVLLAVVASAAAWLREGRAPVQVRMAIWGAPFLVLIQIVLGIASITTFLSVIPVTAHLGVAALLLADLGALYWIACGDPAPVTQSRLTVTLDNEVAA